MRNDATVRLEQTLQGKLPPEHGPEATCGRLAELYLQDPIVPGDPEKALALVGTALAMIDVGHPVYPKLLHVKSTALRRVEQAPEGTLGLAGTAAALDREAWLLSLDHVTQEALLFACEWGDWAWVNRHFDEAADAYDGAGIALSRLILRETPSLDDRMAFLSFFSRIGPHCAYSYAMVGKSRDAAIVLERAAHMLAASSEQQRGLLRLKESGHEDLFDRVLLALKATPSEARVLDEFGRRSDADVARQRTLNQVVNEIRELPGWKQFAAPSSWADIALAAETRSIAYLAATELGTVVCVTTAGASQTEAFCLSPTIDEIKEAAKPFIDLELTYETRSDSRDALVELLKWLGENVLPAVSMAIGPDQPIALVPLGFLALLPLHAPMIETRIEGEPVPHWHFPFHPSHVTYECSARTRAAAEYTPRKTSREALVVSNPLPLPPTLDPLILAEYEAEVLRRHFRVTEIRGREATTESIIYALPSCDVAHFVCHGTFDRNQHYSGVIVIAQSQLLSPIHFVGTANVSARLVFLSACRTAGPALGPSQVVSLPGAFVAAGALAVISTFWHVDEMATLLLATRFYELWQGGDGLRLSEALGKAKEWLATSPASVLRASCPQEALASAAGRDLAEASDRTVLYDHPWYWAGFALMGGDQKGTM
jgi:hypothetical protein